MGDREWNHQFAEINGIRLHYVREGSGMPVVLLHGWPEFWYAFHKLIPLLEGDCEVIAPDLRGFGQSEKPAGAASASYRLEDHVDDLLGLLDHLDIEKAVIVSHDVGSSIAQAVARAHPERVRGLFFFNILYPGVSERLAGPEWLPETWYQGFHQQPWAADLVGSSRDAARIYFKNMLDHWAHRPGTFDDDLETWVDNFLAPGNLQGGFNWYSAIFPVRVQMMRGTFPKPPRIEIPTAVRWGESEPFMKPDFADKLGAYFGDVDFRSVPEAGHFVHYERPDFAAREILDFIGRLG